MRTYLLSLSCALLASPALAQTPDTATTAYKHELGLTAAPQLDKFFKANRTLPVGLLYRRPLTPTRALRLRLVGHYSRVDSTAEFLGYLPGTGSRRWGISVFAGHEWQRPVAKRMRGYYGVELGFGYHLDMAREVRRWANTTGPYYYDDITKIKRWQVQTRGFAGLQWQLSTRLSVFAETAWWATYQYREDDSKQTGYQEFVAVPNVQSSLGGFSYYESKTVSLNWRPVQFIGLSARF